MDCRLSTGAVRGASFCQVNVCFLFQVLELNNDDDSCREVCQKWLKGKTLPLEQKDKEKLYRFLLSRGYEYETIRHTINVVANATDDD